jgi:hypothetical protein
MSILLSPLKAWQDILLFVHYSDLPTNAATIKHAAMCARAGVPLLRMSLAEPAELTDLRFHNPVTLVSMNQRLLFSTNFNISKQLSCFKITISL